jgi:hypothetical protein
LLKGSSPPVPAGWLALNFCEGEEDCTSETLRGQFSIFGAVEENTGYGILQSETNHPTLEHRVVLPHNTLISSSHAATP